MISHILFAFKGYLCLQIKRFFDFGLLGNLTWRLSSPKGLYQIQDMQRLSTPAYFCARIILTAHFSYSFQQLTISKVLSYLFCSSRRSMQPPHPTAGRLHLDPLCLTAGAETSAREIDRRAISRALVSSAKPTTGIQVVRPAAPHGLDSLTPDARRAGPLHPRPHRFASCPSKASLAPG